MKIETILGSRNRVHTLRALFGSDGLSGRQLAAASGLCPSASKAAVDELVSSGIVLRLGGPSRFTCELNRSHYLLPALEALFGQERKAATRIARLLRGILGSCDPAVSTAFFSLDGNELDLALSPLPAPDHRALALSARALQAEFGVNLRSVVAEVRSLPKAQLFRLLPTSSSSGGASSRQIERTLRFLGIDRRESGDARGPAAEPWEGGKDA